MGNVAVGSSGSTYYVLAEQQGLDPRIFDPYSVDGRLSGTC